MAFRFQNALLPLLFGGVAFGLMALLSLRVFQHDDFMYVTTASLWPQLALYTQLPFLQMPLMAWLQGGLAAMVPLAHLYVALLFLSLLLFVAGGVILLRLLAGRGAGPWALLGLWLLLLNNRAAIVTMAVASNHALQWFLAMLLFALLLKRTPTVRTSLLAGALLGLLVLCKLNSLPFVLPVLWWLWAGQCRLRNTAAVVLAGLLVMGPFLLQFWQHAGDIWFANVTAPAFNSQLRGVSTGWLDNRLPAVLGEVFLAPVFLAAVLVAALLLFVRPVFARPVALQLVFLLAAVVAALLPGKVYVYHFLLPYAVLCFMLVQFLAVQPLTRYAVPLLVLALGWNGLIWQREMQGTQMQYGNKVERLQKVALAYQDQMAGLAAGQQCATRIYSMAAIPLLGGPLPIAPESAAGPFLQRVGSYIAPTESSTRFVAPTQLLANQTALLVGYHAKEAGYEEALVAEAVRQHYSAYPLGVFPIAYGEGEWMLYLPPCKDDVNER